MALVASEGERSAPVSSRLVTGWKATVIWIPNPNGPIMCCVTVVQHTSLGLNKSDLVSQAHCSKELGTKGALLRVLV